MPLVPIKNVGRGGIVNDIPGYELPPEAWTDGENVRFYDGAVWKGFGEEAILGTPTVVPLWAIPAFDSSGNVLFAYFSTLKAFATDGVTHTEITRGTPTPVNYTGGVDDLWNGVMLGNIGVFNNGVNDPQVWINPQLSTPLVALANWPALTDAKVIRAFKRFLVAGDITKNSARNAALVKWSNQADIGAVPSSWDETDPTVEAGEWPLIESDGAILDMLELGDINIIYKEDQVHIQEFIGGVFVFRFDLKFRQWGILAQRCVQEYLGKHIVMTPDDVVAHDGFEVQSLLNDRMRRFYKGRVNPERANRSFMASNFAEDEVWCCFPDAGEDYPNIAMVLNLKDGTISIRPLGNMSHIMESAFDPNSAGTTFDSQNIPFDQIVGQFGQRNFNPGRKRLIQCDPDAVTPRFVLADQGFDFAGVNFRAFVEREGLAIVGQDRQGNPKSDRSARKLVTEVWPDVRLQNGTTIQVFVGGQEVPDGPINWNAGVEYNPTTDEKVDVDPPVECKFIAVRFETPNTVGTSWKLDGYQIEVTPIGH